MNDTPLGTFLDEVSRLDTFIEVALEGFGYSLDAETVTDFIRSKVLEKGSPAHPVSNDQVYQYRKKRAKALGDFARAEIALGNPYLFSLAVVRLYSIVEAAVDAIFLTSITDRPEILDSDAFSKLKGPLVSFARATDDERAETLKDRFMQDRAPRDKVGVGRFECLWRVVGMTTPIPDVIRRIFLELSEVRHLIVHRNAIVDRKFLRRCPWLRITVGEPHEISGADYRIYSLAATWYLMESACRWQAGNNETPEFEVITLKDKLVTTLEERYRELRPDDSTAEPGTSTTA